MIDRRWPGCFLLLLLFCCLLFFPSITRCAEIIGPETKIVNNEIHVTTGLMPDEEQLHDVKNGIAKGYIYIDLFRVWNIMA